VPNEPKVALKRLRVGLRTRVARTLVSVLVGTLFVPVGSVVLPSTAPSANASQLTWSNASSVTPSGNWHALATSADGTKVVAAIYGGKIYTSSDSGANWTERTNSTNRDWLAVAITQSSNVIYGAYRTGDNSGGVAVSTDFGATWSVTSAPSDCAYQGIATSGTSNVSAACTGTNSGIWYNTNNGSGTWTRATGTSGLNWTDLESSSDGSKLIASAWASGIYMADNGTFSYTNKVNATLSAYSWSGIAINSNGSRLIALSRGGGPGGRVYTSTDSGSNWAVNDGAGAGDWMSASISANGNTLVAVAFGAPSKIAISTNSGSTWVQQTGTEDRNFIEVAMSDNGSRFVAAAYGGPLFKATGTVSDDANLSALALSTGTLSPTFASGTTSYTASVFSSSITLTPTRSQANASITVNGTPVTSGTASGSISLNIGSNNITVIVTAENGSTTKTYMVNVTRSANITTSNVVVTPPILGATPQTSISSNGQYTTQISWSGSPSTFADRTSYTAQVTVTPITGYSLTNVSANFFTINGLAPTTGNSAGAGVFSHTFQATTPGSIQFAGNGFVKHVIPAPGSDSFTVEVWESSSALSTGTPRIFNTGHGFNAQNIVVRYNEAGSTCLVANVAGEFLDNGSGSTCSASATPGSWHHIALVSSGGSTPTVGLYVNGVRVLSKTFASALNLTGANMVLGATENAGGQEHFTGSMSNFRYVKSAVYSGASFTAPTSPLTRTSATDLLLSTLYDAPPTNAATALAVAIRDYSRNSIAGSTGGTAPLASARHPFVAPTLASATITGTVQRGETLTAQPGAMTGFGNNITYQWQSSATSGGTYTDIGSATASTYVLQSADATRFINVVITVTNAGGSASRTSSASGPVSNALSISSLTVTEGPRKGGTSSRIIGTGLTGTTSVTVGGNQATGVTVISDTSVAFVTPFSGPLGARDVVVSRPGGSVTRSNGFTYLGITSGALIEIDASLSASYSGSGSTWTDVSGGGNSLAMSGATYDSTLKVFSFSNPGTKASSATDGQFGKSETGTILANIAWTGFTASFTANLGNASTIAPGQTVVSNRASPIFSAAELSGPATAVKKGFWLSRQSDGTRLELTNSSDNGGTRSFCRSAADLIINDTFAHYAVSAFANGTCIFYRNGVEHSTGAHEHPNVWLPLQLQRLSFFVARSHYNVIGYADIKVRNLAIYRTALTGTEIATNYGMQRFDDAALSGLSVSAGNLSPSFTPDTLNYTVTVPSALASGFTVTPAKRDFDATVVGQYQGASGTTPFVGSLNQGENIIRILVRAADGTTTRTYQITVTRPPVPAISSLNTGVGPTTGGTTVTINGTTLSAVTSVSVGGIAVNPDSKTATTVTFRTPSGTLGAKDVSVTNGTDTATRTSSFTYELPKVTCRNSVGAEQSISADAAGVVASHALASCHGPVVVGAGVTQLSAGAFLTSAQYANAANPQYPADFNTKVTRITFHPTGFTTLDAYSLAQLTSVGYVALPNSVVSLVDNVFSRSQIQTLDMAAYVGNYTGVTIGTSVFSNATLPEYIRDCTAQSGVPGSSLVQTRFGGAARTPAAIVYCIALTTKTLGAFTPSVGTLNTSFASGTFSYTTTVPNATTAISINTTSTSATSSIHVGGNLQKSGSAGFYFNPSGTSNTVPLEVGVNYISVVVTPQDQGSVNTYTLTVTRQGATQETLTVLAETTTAVYNGSTYTAMPQLSSTGGSGTGALTYTVTNGTATLCTLSSATSETATLTASTSGTCLIRANKAGSAGFEPAISAPLTFTFQRAKLIPIFDTSTVTQTADGFRLQISNYNSAYTWDKSNSLGKTTTISSTGLITVTGVSPGTASTVTITTTRTGYDSATATSLSYSSITGAAKVFSFGTATRTASGFTLPITNYETLTSWSATNSLGGQASINSSTGLITVTGINPGTASTVTVVATRTGYATATETSTAISSLTGAAKSFSFGTATRTSDGFTLPIVSYETLTSWSVTNSLGKSASIDNATGVITVSGVNPGTASTVTVVATRTGYETGTATSPSYFSLTGGGKIPQFETATSTADGFTLVIANYETATSWSVTNSLGRPASINSTTGLITVSGVNPGTPSTVTVTTTRIGYETATATSASYSSIIGAAKTPLFETSTVLQTASGFQLRISNYDAVTTWSATHSLGKSVSIDSTGLITVSGVNPGTASTVTITTTRTGYETGTATSSPYSSVTGSQKIPQFGTGTPTLDGFTLQITNYETLTSWSVTNSLGKPATIETATGLITVTGMPSGTASTVTVQTARLGYETGTATSGSISSATAATQPTGVSATVAARSSKVTWNAPASTGGIAITDYAVEYSSTNGETWTAVSRAPSVLTEVTISGLLDGTPYLYRVAAINAAGQSPFSTSSAVRTSYYVICTSGSFWVAGDNIPSGAGVGCTGTATIPQGIKSVSINSFAPGSGATSVNRGLTAIVFPATGFEEIGIGGFMNLGLTTLTIPASVRSVGQYGFQNNPLTSVTITGGSGGATTLLKDAVFANAAVTYGLTTQIALTLGSGKIDLADNFGSGTKFSTVDFGPSLNSIGVNVFKMNSITDGWIPIFPSTITSIGAGAFAENPRMRTIRFGSSTASSSITSIGNNAFDGTSVKSVQYCGPESGVLWNYLKGPLVNAKIWCNFVAPNAPTISSSSKSNQQVTINWTRGATLNEAPTDTFTVQYQTGGGAWTTVAYDTTTPISSTVNGLVNGTTYRFRVAANNIAGASSFSNTVDITPLGPARTPTIDTSTATATGFTFNVTNYDSVTAWSGTVTAGSGTVTLGTPSGSILPVTVSGMSSGATSSVQIITTRTAFETGTVTTAGTSLNAALTPTYETQTVTTNSYTVAITNYNSNYEWSVTSSAGTASIVSGAVIVTVPTFATAATITVSAARSNYVTGSSNFTATTLPGLAATYYGNGNTLGTAPSETATYATNASLILLGNSGELQKPGYTFDGWNLNPANTGPTYQAGASYTLANTGVAFYAKWAATPYSVIYNATEATAGAVPVDAGTYTISTVANLRGNSGNLQRTGYSFAGWAANADRTGRIYTSGDTYTVQTSNINLYAAWTPNTYSITFNSNGATGNPSKASDSYTVDSATVQVATVGTMQKTGYNFGGWATQAVGTALPELFTVAANTTLYAQWNIASFTLKYELDGGTGTVPAPTAVAYLEQLTLPTSTGLTRSAPGANAGETINYAFVSWRGPASSYNPGQSYFMPAEDLTFTANWTPIYNVRYSLSGGTVVTPIPDDQKIEGETIIITKTIPTRAGYLFTGWADQSGESTTADAVYTVRPDHYLLYAQWEVIPYAVTYDAAGGTPAPTESSKTIGQSFAVGAAPTKTGYDFMGWSDGTNTYAPGAPYVTQSRNITLTAQWQAQTYIVTYDLNGGSGSAGGNRSYTYATPEYTLPTTGFSLTDYSFGGWATSVGGASVGATFAPSSNVTLYAIWNIAIYRLSFNAGAGSVDTLTAKVTIGQAMTLPTATRTNYDLQGWSTEQSGGTITAGGASFTPTSDATLYAQWTLKIFTATYNGNGGVADTATASVTAGSTTSLILPSASRTNYVFDGWYSAAVGGYLIGLAGANFLPTASTTIFAHWIQASLVGLGVATKIAEVTVNNTSGNTFTAGSGGSTATVNYTANSLPNGSVITAYVQGSSERAASLIDPTSNYLLSLVVAWVAPDGTVPDTAPDKPIVVTITNDAITKGSRIFKVVGTTSRYLGTATQDKQVQVFLTQDPTVTVAITRPDSPTAVTALLTDATSALITWEAPEVTGGAPITEYVATSNAGQSCTTATTSCTITGLSAGTTYTFTVIARNVMGASNQSIQTASITTVAAPVTPTVNNSASAALESLAAAARQAEEEKAAAELKAAEEKAAAELKAAQEKAAAEVKAAEEKAAAELKAAEEKAAAELKAIEEAKAQQKAIEDAAKAAGEIVPAVTVYSITNELTLSDYDLAYLRAYLATLKPRAMLTCIGYTYTTITTQARATALAKKQATALCAIIKKERTTLSTSILIRPAESAPPAAAGSQWVAVSYRVDSYQPITPTTRYQAIQTGVPFLAYMPSYTAALDLKKIALTQCTTNKNLGLIATYGSAKKSITITEYSATQSCSFEKNIPKNAKRTIVVKAGGSKRPGARIALVTVGLSSLEIKKLVAGLVRVPLQ
jgi:uncharacterized repeat protein (TIGR02543 family)